MVDKGRDAAVGVDLKEPGFLLLVLVEVQRYNLEIMSVLEVRRRVSLIIPCIRDQALPRRSKL